MGFSLHELFHKSKHWYQSERSSSFSPMTSQIRVETFKILLILNIQLYLESVLWLLRDLLCGTCRDFVIWCVGQIVGLDFCETIVCHSTISPLLSPWQISIISSCLELNSSLEMVIAWDSQWIRQTKKVINLFNKWSTADRIPSRIVPWIYLFSAFFR